MSVKSHQARVRALGCLICGLEGTWGVPASIHHVEAVRDELSEFAVVPLCYDHHQGPNGVHVLGRRGFVARYKLTDVDLLAIVNRELSK